MGAGHAMKQSDGTVAIRPLELGDLDRVLSWIRDPLIMRRIGLHGERTMESQERWFRGMVDDEHRQVWAIELVESNRHIGNISLYDIDRLHAHAGIAIFIGDRELRGAGYGKRALRLMLDHVFQTMGLHRVYCKTEASFEGTIDFYESLGFTREGTLREHEHFDGAYTDKVVFGLLDREFIPDSRPDRT